MKTLTEHKYKNCRAISPLHADTKIIQNLISKVSKNPRKPRKSKKNNSPSKSVLTTETWREGSLLKGIVDCGRLGKDFAKDHAESAHDVGDEK